MAKAQQLRIDLDHVLETLRKGVRRADVFMGIGLNAAEQDPPPSHILAPESGLTIQLVKQNLTESETAHVATEFGKWIRANGLRELMETFSIFMHELYTVHFLVLRSLGKLGDLSRIRPTRFERMGIADQIDTMSKAIAISADDLRIVRSLNQSRNCYAHRRGVVGNADLHTESGVFELLWLSFQIEIVEPDGNVVPAPDIYGRVFENGGLVQMRPQVRSKRFERGEELVVGKQELKEICFCVLSMGRRLLNETVKLARNEGVLKEKVNDGLVDPKPI